MPDTALDLSVYLVTDSTQCRRLGVVETVVAAIKGGVTAVQLRDKHAADGDLVSLGRVLRERMAGSRVPLILNDRVEVAAAIGADGVHVGQSDVGVHEVRKRLGPDAILGLSVQTVEQVRAVDPALVDYVGIGPVFATATKPDHAQPLGFDGLAEVCAVTPVPAVAIGGLGAEHMGAVLAAGAVGAALVSAICGASDPEQAARALADASRRARAAVGADA